MTVTRMQAMNYGHDGFMDLAMGGVLIAGALLLAEGAALAVVFVPFIIIAMQALKQAVTKPRLRDDEAPVPAATSPAQLLLRWLMLGVAVIGVLVFMAVDPYDGGAQAAALTVVIAALVAGVALVMAGRSHEMHYYAYLALAAWIAASAWMPLDLRAVLVVGGTVAVVFGAFELSSFIRRHPVRHHY